MAVVPPEVALTDNPNFGKAARLVPFLPLTSAAAQRQGRGATGLDNPLNTTLCADAAGPLLLPATTAAW